MKGDIIPDNNNIARLCKPSTIDNGQIQAPAFFLGPKEDSLSVNWLEFLKCTNREREITIIREIYSQKLIVSEKAKVAILNVGKIRKNVRTFSTDHRNLGVLHDPLDIDPSHSGIYNLKQKEQLIAELILETVLEAYPARK